MADSQQKILQQLQEENAELREQLNAVQRKYSFATAILNEIPHVLFAKDADARFCFFNKAYEKFFSVSSAPYLHKTALELDYASEEERRHEQEEDVRLIASGTEIRLSKQYATPKGVFDTLYRSKGICVPETGDKGLVGIIVDISEEKRLGGELSQKVQELESMRQELELLCRTDALTNLPNRRPFEEVLQSSVGIARRHDYPLSLLMADIDHFKRVNDTFGHDVGDKVLCSFAHVLRNSCRVEDLVARVGGEEFVLLMQVTDLYDAVRAAQRLCDRMRELPVLPDGGCVTVSFGATQYINGEDPARFIKRADDALYRAKEQGRNRVCALSPEDVE